MRNILITVLLLATFGFGCSSSKKTPHEKYAEKLDDTNLEETQAGRLWLAASKTALQYPQTVELPYRQQGYFGTDKPRALGLKFMANRGEKLTFTLTKKTGTTFTIYADVFKLNGTESSLLHAADTAASEFGVDIEETGNYLLRLQPELFQSGAYMLSVSIGPSLGFPVSGSKAKTGSFWGARRGGGKRSHEGIDIFAPRLTPVLAAEDGIITAVKEGGLGGKVVWQHSANRNLRLYYAHLHKQLVHVGQEVKKGDVLGLVGNTGNARHTPSHLHFGVYLPGGPIDPYPFVNPLVKSAPPLPDKNLTNYIRLTKTQKLTDGNSTAKVGTLLIPIGANNNGYIAELPDGKTIQLPFAAVQPSFQPVKVEEIMIAENKKNKKKKQRM